MDKEAEKKKKDRNLTIVSLVLIFIVLLGAVIIYYNEKNRKLQEFKQFLRSSDMEEEEYKKVVEDIVTGKIEVPPEINKSKKLIIREYMYSCNELDDLNKKIECFELYYFSYNPDLKKQKELCLENKDSKCLDQYYYNLGVERGSTMYCQAVQDEPLRNKCFEVINV